MYDDYFDPETVPYASEVDVIFERNDDGAELGLTVRGATRGPSTIAEILEAIAIHDVNTSDPLQGMKEVLQKHRRFNCLRLFRGNFRGRQVFAGSHPCGSGKSAAPPGRDRG